MTLQEVVDYVLGNLGGRYEGLIGREQPSAAALREINLAVKEISKIEDAPEFEYIHETTLLSGVSSFALPVITGQRTRSVSGFFFLEGDHYYPIAYLIHEEFFKTVGNIGTVSSTRPQVFSYFANTIHFYPTLQEETDFKMYLSLYPPIFTGTDLENELAIDPDWDTAIIAYATYKLFLRLQQAEDYSFWKREYETCKQTALHALRKRRMEPDFSPEAGIQDYYSGNPALDPFVKHWPKR